MTRKIQQVEFASTHPQTCIAASMNSVYQSLPNGDFRKVFNLKGEVISHLHIDPLSPEKIYIAADRNAYCICDTQPRRIFSADEDEQIHAIISWKDELYLGTSRRLIHAQSTLLDWKTDITFNETNITTLQSDGIHLYIICDSGVYRINSAGTCDKIFSTRKNGDDQSHRALRIISDKQRPGQLWLGTNKGLYQSNDNGAHWNKCFIRGLGSSAVTYLSPSPNNPDELYLCSAAGLFKYNSSLDQAENIHQGIPSSQVHWLGFDLDQHIYLATDLGLFSNAPMAQPTHSRPTSLEELLSGEPSIQEVQDAALRYNTVHPQKTGSWRKKVKYRALLPKLSVDYDKTIGSSFTQSSHYYATGPFDWGISLTWDMGDLLWNSYEDDIDNRAKITTQLRMDILDEVNRLYFERLRLKHELTQSDPSNADYFEKMLRLAEMTASLDGYTGGLYSNALNQH